MMPTLMESGMLPMRSAEEQFALAGANGSLLTVNPANGLHYVDGVGGPAVMEGAEYERYKRLCAAWCASPLDLHNAPGVSMLEATAEEELEFSEMLQAAAESASEYAELTPRPRSYLALALREIEQLLFSYNQAVCRDEEEDIIVTLISKLKPLKEAVLRAEEIWREGAEGGAA